MDEKINEEMGAEETENAEVKPEAEADEGEKNQAQREYSELVYKSHIKSGEEETPAESQESSPFSVVFDAVSILATATVIVAFAFIFCFRTVGISGSSMFPTLEDGNRIILSAFIKEPKSGEIVVTCQPSPYDYVESTLVKRVIATEGQTVDIDFDAGIVYVDGKALDEPYVNELTHDSESFNGPITVPEDYVFVMGDNRNASTDSRDYRVGYIREDYIMGKALFRIKPLSKYKIG